MLNYQFWFDYNCRFCTSGQSSHKPQVTINPHSGSDRDNNLHHKLVTRNYQTLVHHIKIYRILP